MTIDQYLKNVLSHQRLTDGELDELRAHRADVQTVLEDHFRESSPYILYAGSYKKKTMIRDAYDLDVTCYFGHEDTAAGPTLSEIYDACADALMKDYHVQRKRSALRVMEKGALVSRTDFRIDVVPGRYTNKERSDAFLHQEEGGKTRLKTNLQVHVEHIRDSGVRDAIKLLKLWRYQRSIEIKTFVLELLAVDLLKYLNANEAERAAGTRLHRVPRRRRWPPRRRSGQLQQRSQAARGRGPIRPRGMGLAYPRVHRQPRLGVRLRQATQGGEDRSRACGCDQPGCFPDSA